MLNIKENIRSGPIPLPSRGGKSEHDGYTTPAFSVARNGQHAEKIKNGCRGAQIGVP